ncbi:MAG TPA: hypothetical protein VFS97_14845 [Nitrososphaeraceae archaeon]|jgi:hypothetical protein|nr:hypothetical protein [Nitrososphaeraceae archaeon]
MNWQEQPLQPLENEEPLLYIVRKKGWIRKHTEVLFLSNKRVIRELPQQNILQQLSLQQIDHIEVINQCHDFKAYYTTGVGVRQSSLRTVSYQSQGVNRTVGDIIFYSKLALDIHFYGIADPASVKRLVDALRKQQPV